MSVASSASGADASSVAAFLASSQPRLELELLEAIRTAQQQNGLRHSDYARYRLYCTRRLRRLRGAKTAPFTHGKGRKFAARPLTPATVADPRHLLLALFSAERAWAASMELQQEEAGGGEGARSAAKHSHMLARLRKAAKWAALLAQLCGARCDARSGLESEAYAAWMRGSLCVVQQDWAGGLEHLARCSAIYAQLAAVAAHRQKALFAARLQEIEPNERYCRYQLMRKQGRRAADAAAASAAGGDASASAAVGSRELQSKIDLALAEHLSSAQQGGDGVSAVTWRRTILPIRSERLRKVLGAAQDKAGQLAAMFASASPGASNADSDSALTASGAPGAGGRPRPGCGVAAAEPAYIDLLVRYDEASRVALTEAARLTREGKEAAASDLAAVDAYARFLRARHGLDRTLLAVDEAAAGLDVAEAALLGLGPGNVGEAQANHSFVRAKGKGGMASSKSKPSSAAASASSTAAGADGESSASPWASSPLHQALAKHASASAPTLSAGSASGAVAPGSSAATDAAAAVAAAQVVAWYARALRALDDMVVLAGGSSSGGGGIEAPPATSAASSASAAAGFSLPADAELLACLQARRAVLLAWRAWFVALQCLHSRRFADAADLLGRARTRVESAAAAYDALLPPASAGAEVDVRALPALASLPDAAAPEAGPGTAPPSHFHAMSGVSGAERRSLELLLSLLARRSVAIRAGGLLEQLAPLVRADAEVSALFRSQNTLLAATSATLVRGTRRQFLVDREAYASTLEPTGDVAADVAAVAPHPAAPRLVVSMPVKPIVLDLAFAGIPEPPAAPAPAAAPAAAAASLPAKGGGLLSFLSGR